MKNVEAIAQKLARIGKKVYVVGSYNVHTILRKNFGSDIDLATPAKPEEIKSVLKVIASVGSKFGTFLIKEGGEVYELTIFRKEIGSVNHRKPAEVEFTTSLEEDAKRRDFTFNAIYFEPLEKRYIDPTGGIEDLEKGIIRFVGDIEKRLDEDALRFLRYIRLKNKHSFIPAESGYEEVINRRVLELKDISIERIKQELDKILVDKSNVRALEELKNCGFLREFLPHIDNLSLAPGGKKMHLEGDVWKHTLMSIEALNHMKCHDVDLFWATLFHDIGKYSTYTHDPNGNVHYFSHEDEGVKIFEEFIKKDLKFSRISSLKIKWLIKNHIRVGMIENMKKTKRYHFMLHPYFNELIKLYTVDNLGKEPQDTECGPRLQKIYDEFIAKFNNTKFLNGKDIMKKYPDLKGKDIGLRLKTENDKILRKI